jgi:hypothetical protein
MKRHLLVAAAAFLATHTLFGQTWQTVDDFQYAPNHQVWARSGAVDALGRVYVSGSGNDTNGTGTGIAHGFVMRSADQGATWSTIEDYIHNDTNRFTYLQGVGFDSAQNIYAVGYAQYIGTPVSTSSVFVRKSADNGATWQTVLDLGFSGSASISANPGTPGFAADSSGAVYVFADIVNTGTLLLKSSDAGVTWTMLHPFTDTTFARGIVCTPGGVFVIGGSVTRKSTDGGVTWKTVDTGFSQTAICTDSQGNIYTGGGANVTTGSGKKAVTTYDWIIRKGASAGATWQTAAAFSINGFSDGPYITALHFDALGTFYAAGALTAANGSGIHWVTTKSSNQGVSWSVSDDFQYTSGSSAYGWFLTSDFAGAVYSGGMAMGGGEHWIVRRRLGP